MSTPYAVPLPNDKNGNPLQGIPSPKVANTRYGSENGTASSVMTMTDNTTVVEIAAIGGPAVMRWVAASDTQASVISAVATANFDYVIPSATMRRFVVPIESVGVSSVVGINPQAGLYRRYAVKSIGVASVLSSEY